MASLYVCTLLGTWENLAAFKMNWQSAYRINLIISAKKLNTKLRFRITKLLHMLANKCDKITGLCVKEDQWSVSR